MGIITHRRTPRAPFAFRWPTGWMRVLLCPSCEADGMWSALDMDGRQTLANELDRVSHPVRHVLGTRSSHVNRRNLKINLTHDPLVMDSGDLT